MELGLLSTAGQQQASALVLALLGSSSEASPSNVSIACDVLEESYALGCFTFLC